MRKVTALSLLGLGLVMWLTLTQDRAGIPKPPLLTGVQIGGVLIGLALGLVPGVSGAFVRSLDRIRRPLPRDRALVTAAAFICTNIYLVFTAFRQHRELYPRYHDDHMHLLQMRLMSCFRLWTESHPMADFFDTFHTIVRPVYASIYFPGTALLYVWQIWVDAPVWLGPSMVAAGVVALMYRVVGELLDDAVLGGLSALLVLGVWQFRYLSMVIMSHTVLMLLGLLVIWAYLRWRGEKRWWWAAVIGGLAGWAAITRPLDALCYVAPVGVLMAWELWRVGWGKFAKTAAVVVVAAAPFLSLQLVFNKGVTGEWLKPPYQFYHEQYAPNLAYGRTTFDPNLKPQTLVPQKLVYDKNWNARALAQQAQNSPWGSWFKWKFRQLMSFGLAAGIVAVLLPVGLLGLWRRDAWALWGMLPCYVTGYAFFAFLLPHYCAVPSPGLALTTVLGLGVLREVFPRWRAGLETAGVLGLLAVTVLGLSEFTPRTAANPYGTPDDYLLSPTMRVVAEDMPGRVAAPAVVLFRYSEGEDYNQEPVFNYQSCNPDDAAIIRAHDLGIEKNREIFDYYARTQPGRNFYLFDRKAHTITPMGTARELAAAYPLIGGGASTRPSSAPASAP